MEFSYTSPCEDPFLPTLQRPQACDACYSSSHIGSPSPSSPPSLSPRGSVAESATSETDDDSVFPWTPDSKHSGGVRCSHTSAMAASPTPSRTSVQHHKNHQYHPYRRPPSFQESHTFDFQLGRSDIDDSTTSGKFDDKFLKHLDALGPQMFGLVVHLQEAVRERQRMRLFTTYWEVEENSRRGALLRFLYKDAEKDFSGTERDARVLLSRFLTIHPPAAVAADAKFLSAVCNRNKTSLRRTDTQLDILKDHLDGQSLGSHGPDKNSDVTGDSLATG
ncbi:hypothetical protein C8R48DRAFT_782313 [Suillus tomentosus]|nr:hypothetical protein C8R48DRAFT_782313 [Suillus tomentosus]